MQQHMPCHLNSHSRNKNPIETKSYGILLRSSSIIVYATRVSNAIDCWGYDQVRRRCVLTVVVAVTSPCPYMQNRVITNSNRHHTVVIFIEAIYDDSSREYK